MPDIGTDIATPPALSATSDAPVVEPVVVPASGPPELPPDEVAPKQTSSPAPDTAPDVAPNGGEPGSDDEGQPPGEPKTETRRQRFGERLSEMAAQRRAAEQRADRLAEMLERTLAHLPQPAQDQPRQEAQPDPRPQREEYADPDAYDAALIEWSARVATRVASTEADKRAAEQRETEARARTEEQQKQEQDRLMAQWNQGRDKLLENPEYADWEEVATNPNVEIPMTMVPAILNADNGPQVLYHLGKNPDEASRIAKLPPLAQAVEIGKISAILAQPPRPAPRKLAPPIEPVGTRNNAAPKTPDEETMNEYAARRNSELANAQRRGSVFGRA